jgi:hypothetical protein
MMFRQGVKTVTHVVELLNFVQDRVGCMGYLAFLKPKGEKNFRWADVVQGPERGEGGNYLSSIISREQSEMLRHLGPPLVTIEHLVAERCCTL